MHQSDEWTLGQKIGSTESFEIKPIQTFSLTSRFRQQNFINNKIIKAYLYTILNLQLFSFQKTYTFLESSFDLIFIKIIYKIGFWNVWFALILTYRFEMFLNSSLGQRLNWLFFGWFEISATHERKSCRPRSAGLDKCVLEFLDILRFQLIFW